VHDNGIPLGLKASDRLLQSLGGLRSDGNILPQPVLSVSVFSFDTGDVIVLEIQPSPFPPVRYKGKTWIRVGPRKAVANEMEERILSERRSANVSMFDIRPCLEASLADLDLDLFRNRYLPNAIDAELLANDERDIRDQMNALMHRDYESNAPIKFYQYDNRIEISNAGGLYGKARPENFPNENDYRNPTIAEAMKTLGYVNRFNRGISRVQQELKENGNPDPVFDYQRIGVFGVSVFEMWEEKESPPTDQISSVKTSVKILELINGNNRITIPEMAEKIGISVKGVEKNISSLKKEGYLERAGSRKTGYWVVKSRG